MANKSEIAKIRTKALKTWADFAECLAERGETWPNTDPKRWGQGTETLHLQFITICEVLEILTGRNAFMIGSEIQDQYEAGKRILI